MGREKPQQLETFFGGLWPDIFFLFFVFCFLFFVFCFLFFCFFVFCFFVLREAHKKEAHKKLAGVAAAVLSAPIARRNEPSLTGPPGWTGRGSWRTTRLTIRGRRQ